MAPTPAPAPQPPPSWRAQAKAEREAAIAAGEPAQPLCEWTPRRDVARPRPPPPSAVPTLQQLVVDLLVEHIADVVDFGVLSPAILHALAAQLCARRRFSSEQLPLFTPASADESRMLAFWRLNVKGEEAVGELGRPARPLARPEGSKVGQIEEPLVRR